MRFATQIRRLISIIWLGAGVTLGGCAGPTGPNVILPTDPAALQQMADRGNPFAANNLGVLYANGVKVPQDFAEARKWFEFAGEHGNPAGEFNLGIAYQKGQGTVVDQQEALKWFHQAADHNYAPAKLQLALLYVAGTGVPRDPVEAVRLTKSAAIQGLPLAQLFLAGLYLDGNGLPTDDGLAYQWASLASSKLIGPPSMVANVMRDNAATGLSPAELTAAQTAAAAWKPGTDLVSLFSPAAGPRPPRLRGTGSGFLVGKDGEVATDYHVVPNCKLIKLIDPAGKFNVESRVVAADQTDDLALVAGGGFGTRLKIRTTPAELGESITSYGFPLGPVLSSSGNLASGTVSSATGFQGNVKAFQISAPEQAGSSGGPVVDDGGAVVGMVASKLNALAVAASTGDLSQNVNFAWRIGLLEKLMDQKGIGYEQSPKGHARSATDLAGLLQKGTVKIECWR